MAQYTTGSRAFVVRFVWQRAHGRQSPFSVCLSHTCTIKVFFRVSRTTHDKKLAPEARPLETAANGFVVRVAWSNTSGKKYLRLCPYLRYMHVWSVHVDLTAINKCL
jgi:hypothetical protein